MMETSTSLNQLNYQKSEMEPAIENIDSIDLAFYENLKLQLDALSRNPSDESVKKILEYARKK